jgi:hypothetical protein
VSVITQDLFSPPLYERWESVAELTCHLQGSTPYGKILSHNFQAVAHLGCSIEGSSPYRGTACKGVDFNGISIHIWEAVQWINAGTVPDKRTWSVAPKALRLVETFAYRNSKSLRLAGSFTNRIPCGKYPDWPLRENSFANRGFSLLGSSLIGYLTVLNGKVRHPQENLILSLGGIYRHDDLLRLYGLYDGLERVGRGSSWLTA